MAECIVCGTTSSEPGRVCLECTRITGVIELAPPRRRDAPCLRCNHTKLIRVVPRELSVNAGRDFEKAGDSNVAVYGPMYATYDVKRRTEYNYFKPNRTVSDPPMAYDGFGVLEAYICRRCGFVDWYCQDPERIPIGPEYMTEDIDCTSDNPYR